MALTDHSSQMHNLAAKIAGFYIGSAVHPTGISPSTRMGGEQSGDDCVQALLLQHSRHFNKSSIQTSLHEATSQVPWLQSQCTGR